MKENCFLHSVVIIALLVRNVFLWTKGKQSEDPSETLEEIVI